MIDDAQRLRWLCDALFEIESVRASLSIDQTAELDRLARARRKLGDLVIDAKDRAKPAAVEHAAALGREAD